MIPDVVQYGLAKGVLKAREKVFLAAHKRHPEGFVSG
jgi:hypothetical protein